MATYRSSSLCSTRMWRSAARSISITLSENTKRTRKGARANPVKEPVHFNLLWHGRVIRIRRPYAGSSDSGQRDGLAGRHRAGRHPASYGPAVAHVLEERRQIRRPNDHYVGPVLDGDRRRDPVAGA